MAFNINEIRSQLVGGGARPSLFQVRLLNPADGTGDLKAPFMIKAASIPTSTLSAIEVPYFGRRIKVAGTRTYETWSVTVINDEDFLVRSALEEWSRRINTYAGNLRQFGSSRPAEYKSRAEVVQYGQTGKVLRTYQFEGLFPLNVNSIELNWESGDQVEEFTVDFAYDFWQVRGRPA